MCPGRLPNDDRPRRFSLSFAVCLVLGPAIFLAILAYEGAFADDLVPFDDVPSHHHLDITQKQLLRFCTYLDGNNHIQAKAGPCNETSTPDIHHEHNVILQQDFCIETIFDGMFNLVNCSNITTPQLVARQLQVAGNLGSGEDQYVVPEPPVCDGDMIHGRSSCRVVDTDGAKGDAVFLSDLESLPLRHLKRANSSVDSASPIQFDKLEMWTGTKRCTKGFCTWAHNAHEVERRCYDGNPETPPTPDQVLKYTAPFECNVCLDDKKYQPDRDHIQRHCIDLIKREDFVFKILAGVAGGALVLSIIGVIYREHRRKKRLLTEPEEKPKPEGRFSKHIRQRTPVLPPYDGATDLRLSIFSLTASQRDATEISLKSRTVSCISRPTPEIHVTSPPRSLAEDQENRVGSRSLCHVRDCANSTSSIQQSLPSPDAQKTRQQTLCQDCRKSRSDRGLRSDECNSMCKHCNQRTTTNESESYAYSAPPARVPSERQLVLMPALTRNIDGA